MTQPDSTTNTGAVEALANEAAERMWRIHPNDLDRLDFKHISKGGRYENPRAAYYASEIMNVVRAATPTPASEAGVIERCAKVADAMASDMMIAASEQNMNMFQAAEACGFSAAAEALAAAIRALSPTKEPRDD